MVPVKPRLCAFLLIGHIPSFFFNLKLKANCISEEILSEQRIVTALPFVHKTFCKKFEQIYPFAPLTMEELCTSLTAKNDTEKEEININTALSLGNIWSQNTFHSILLFYMQ